MATEINKLNCDDGAKNTGTGDCPFDMGTIMRHLKVPKGFKMTPVQVAALETTLRTALTAAKGARIYPFPAWEQITDNSEAVQVGSFGYGGKFFGRQGFNDW